jgi:hypothetical protein
LIKRPYLSVNGYHTPIIRPFGNRNAFGDLFVRRVLECVTNGCAYSVISSIYYVEEVLIFTLDNAACFILDRRAKLVYTTNTERLVAIYLENGFNIDYIISYFEITVNKKRRQTPFGKICRSSNVVL